MNARVLGIALLPLMIATGRADAGEPNDLFWVRSSQKSQEQVVAAIKGFAEGRKWLYPTDFKIEAMLGEVAK